eukprot:NODE_318_length_11118_cov_0.235049.p5 type:complete len:253 gc:universal NODE_318_length_11118_cov_0.235049:6427-7185(+)
MAILIDAYILLMLSHMVLGASWLLYIQGMIKCLFIFKNKTSTISLICILGLTCAIIDVTVLVSGIYSDEKYAIDVVIVAPFWFIMIQCASWIYCIRIQSIGGYYSKHDRYIGYVPLIILGFQIPAVIFTVLALFMTQYREMGIVCGIVLSVAITILEIYMFSVLIIKLQIFLEFRENTKSILIYQMTAALALMVVLEILLIISKAVFYKFDVILRPFTYLLRIVIVLQFYDELLSDLDSIPLSNLVDRKDDE